MISVKDPFEEFDMDLIVQLARSASSYRPSIMAPNFCRDFSHNLYMVRKYVRWDYPIDPERTIPSPEWLFSPPQSAIIANCVLLEREVGPTDYFRSGGGTSDFVRTIRIEAVLNWAESIKNSRVLRAKKYCGRDLTSVDDSLVEAIVAYLLARAFSVPANAIEFISDIGAKTKTPEFRITLDECIVLVEVKHLRKHPQSEAERRWLELFAPRTAKRSASFPMDEVAQRVAQATSGFIQEDELPWQVSTKTIHDRLNNANEKFRVYAPESTARRVRLTVIHSDDPFGSTRIEGSSSDGLLENRIASGISTWLNGDHADCTDAVLILANPFGFPIGSGYEGLLFQVRHQGSPALKRIVEHFPALHPMPMVHTQIGFDVVVPAKGSSKIDLKVNELGRFEIKREIEPGAQDQS